MYVENMTSPKGYPWRNQFVIDGKDYRTFQSYSTVVAVYNKSMGILFLNEDARFSRTTTKALKEFVKSYTGLDIVYNDNIISSIEKNPKVTLVSGNSKMLEL